MKYIRTLSAFSAILEGKENVYVSLKLDENKIERLHQVGFPKELKSGLTLLPRVIGPRTRYNAEGQYGPANKSVPKVPYVIERHWERTDWHGNMHSGIIYQHRLKWFREYTPAPSIEMSIVFIGEQAFVRSPLLSTFEPSDLIAAINVFLEVFGEVEFMSANQLPIYMNLHKVNWELLPQGTVLSQLGERDIEKLTTRKSKKKDSVCKYRLSTIESYAPDFVAIGNGGFQGYIVYGFKQHGIFVLESMVRNNATYILNGDWQKISQLSKRDILDQSLHEERIIHNESWSTNLSRLFKEAA
ncbi:hypothetical protein [Pseudoalteromonas xiamenensis]|uniref:Uncharacterized protein n=1 Tax=Pseudoalteromonas xiamenensis TaxID=882626 RepID=A0A975DEJ9_9GAMM|nr:hypothetical protein [Pseudoalteromonas xiamenensis]QTH70381.1 hypothetical protein J5O05_10165 [Pseudoalteromonas xiamenensis]